MLTALVSVAFLATSIVMVPVVPGPNYDNIQYLHNYTFRLSNGTLQGLSAIDNSSGVDPTMAQSLKDAINRAMPNYLFTQPGASNNTSNNNGTSATTSSAPTSTTAPGTGTTTFSPSGATATAEPLNLATSAGRRKRAAVSTTPTASSSTTTQSPSTTPVVQNDVPVSTTQPYGTDAEFWARTDLVYFHVDVDEGSGNGA